MDTEQMRKILLSKERKMQRMYNLFYSVIGAVIYSFAINMIISPMNLYSGGFVGISQLVSTWLKNYFSFGFNIQGILYFLLNIPLFVLGFWQLGAHFMEKSIVVIVLESFFMSVMTIPKVPIIDDVLTCCLLGGILCGVANGLIFRGFASAGGTDILGMVLIRKYKSLSMGKVAMAINLCIFAVAGICLSVETAIYSAIYVTFTSIITDKSHIQNRYVSVFIITKDYYKIEEEIVNRLRRSATVWQGVGAYSKKREYVIVSVMSVYELDELKKVLFELDPTAFVLINQDVSALGNFEKRIV